MITTIARNSKKPMPIRVYVNRSSFIDGLRAMPTTNAANNCPMPCAQPPTATIVIAQPSTETPALRLLRGSTRLCCVFPFADDDASALIAKAGRNAGDANPRHAEANGAEHGRSRATRIIWNADMNTCVITR
eukprot:CAMPEP_0169124110 /NCGR_PEP_ID=MMETSP1015-20121227/34146_1 /TAXON_ID=342587 /ORGANISM="Karlodinium micrum, Strain CCMP2283" /LENGTH=131 /DNA_ID=CAMNT_0009187497 /DNA_START=98 /DNA_END=493 /DNA_ORIENTATION=-